MIKPEEFISFCEAAKRVPGGVHVSTIWRWSLVGVGGVRLESFRFGGRRKTSVEALERFFAATSGDSPVPTVRPAKLRRRGRRREHSSRDYLAREGF